MPTYVSDTALQFTLREMRRLFLGPRVLGALGLGVLILGLSGPFQTFELLAVGPRLAYWAAMALLTFSTGAFFGTWSSRALSRHNWPLGAQVPVAGLAAGLPVAVIVTIVNLMTFSGYGLDAVLLASTAGYSVLVATAVSLIFALLRTKPNPANGQSAAPEPTPLLARLALPQRGKLVSLSVQDHYVEVTTNKAKALVLMRLSDAIAETGGTPGLQIHRSHWVALDEVRRVTKSGGKMMVETTRGDHLPISRSFLGAARDAGLVVQ